VHGDVEENTMKENQKNPSLSRRDFVKTAAVGLGGVSTTVLAGVGAPPVEAAQTGDRLPPSAEGGGVSDKLVITVSPSGRAENLPSQADMRVPKLHADAAVEGFNAGASIVHLRGNRLTQDPKIPQGQRGPELENWREVTSLVRSRCDIVINYGSSAMEPSVRKPLLPLKPDAGSFLVGHHYGGMAVPVEDQRQSALDHLEAGVLPEVEIFHSGDLANLNALIATGLLRPPYCVTLFFNYTHYYAVPASMLELQSRLALLPPNTHWTVCVKGARHLEMAAYAIALGGHVRTGLENNVELAPGRPATSQGTCVERIVRLAQDLGREVATPQEAREMLGLPRRPLQV
jgi:3-keto-5-aminohexanoate cleavage enzyme